MTKYISRVLCDLLDKWDLEDVTFRCRSYVLDSYEDYHFFFHLLFVQFPQFFKRHTAHLLGTLSTNRESLCLVQKHYSMLLSGSSLELHIYTFN